MEGTAPLPFAAGGTSVPSLRARRGRCCCLGDREPEAALLLLLVALLLPVDSSSSAVLVLVCRPAGLLGRLAPTKS